MTLPVFARVRVLGVDERCVASPGPTPPGPRELTGIVDHSRGGSSHGSLEWTWSRVGLAPCIRTGWPSAAKTFAPVSRSRRWIPSRDSKNAIDDQLQDATSVLDAFHIVKLAGDAPGEVCRPRPARHDRSPQAQGGSPLPRSAIFCAPVVIGSRSVNKNDSVRPSWQMRRISVSMSPSFTGQVREVFHQDTPTQGQRLAAHLIQRLPACPVPEIARLGADPTQVEGRLLGLLGYRRSQQRLHGSHQRTLSSWADESPEATATPPATNSECSASQEV